MLKTNMKDRHLYKFKILDFHLIDTIGAIARNLRFKKSLNII